MGEKPKLRAGFAIQDERGSRDTNGKSRKISEGREAIGCWVFGVLGLVLRDP